MIQSTLRIVLLFLSAIGPLAALPQGQAATCVTAPSGLVSWWPGDGNYNDIKGGNNGAPMGTVTFDAGKVNQGFKLLGAEISSGDSHVEVQAAPNLRITGPLTLDAWVSFTEVTPRTPGISNAPIVAKWGDSGRGTAGYGLFIKSDGTPFMAVSFTGSDVTAASASSPLSAGFHHVAGTWTGSELRLYVDGVKVATTPFTGPIHDNARIPLLIGGYNRFLAKGPDSMVGVIDEVEIFDRALHHREIREIFDAGSAGKCKTPDPPAVQKFFTDIIGNPLPTDVAGKPKVDVMASNGVIQSTNPDPVVAIVDVSNPTITTFSTTIQIVDKLPNQPTSTDWVVSLSDGSSTGNMRVCFYDGSAVSKLAGFPFSPNWAFECAAGVDVTGQVSFAGTTQTLVMVSISASSLPTGEFRPGDHITVSMRMQLALAGSSLPSGYFDGSNSDGAFRIFTNTATCTVSGATGTGMASFRGYLMGK